MNKGSDYVDMYGDDDEHVEPSTKTSIEDDATEPSIDQVPIQTATTTKEMPPDSNDMPQTLEEMSTRLEAATKLAEERIEQLQRCRAELENVMKMAEREREATARYASQGLIKKLLGVLDSLEQASKHDEGSKLLFQQLLVILKSEGLSPIDAVGTKFDPFMHEAMLQIEAEDQEDGTVGLEIQKGYMLNDKVIRCSRVGVVKHR
jgi:molecular chaperone GrpE